MAELICNTSVMLALHEILPALGSSVCLPAAVCVELGNDRTLGANVPDPGALSWITTRSPKAMPALPLAASLGAGEREVLWLAMETPASIAVLDDRDARRAAQQLAIPLTGTLGLLLDAKLRGLIPAVAPALDELDRHGFHMSARIRATILKAAGESP